VFSCPVIAGTAFALTTTLFYTLVLLQFIRGLWEDDPVGVSAKRNCFTPDKAGS